MKRLPDHLSRECIIEAIRAYDEGIAHQFKDARLYEVEFEGRRYPSKAIVGIAATMVTKTEFTPADFSGGIKSKCVRLLLEQGFKIVQERVDDAGITPFPDELQTKSEFVEGAAVQVMVNRYERDRQAREAALRYHGTRCQVCGLDMAKRYGDIGQGFIHIHHLVPLSEIKQDYRLDPKTDLIPVCPNCHAMLHRRNPPYTPEELKAQMLAE
ncbi:HNH endonuclease [Klebsiella aerogenes]|uniref:HNH endonuclease n=1 Tax=Klebsiella aerogenes TaxID=548 RepID=UPI0007B34D6F|nr:HNH endonuclease [Klebsiella aerogenes]KZQ43770.1 HNH endonuclease [Klebsiella aerogenes]